MLIFEWDTNKAKSNKQKHGITFDEACSVFADPLSLTIYDPIHSMKEDRFVIIGMSNINRTLTVVHADRGEKLE